MNTIKITYEDKLKENDKLIKELNQKSRSLGLIRLITFLVGISGTLILWFDDHFYLSVGAFLVCTFLFFKAVFMYNTVEEKKNYALAYNEVYLSALNRINGEWKKFAEKGEEFINHEHPFSSDLDIFGENSLFQWLNTATTCGGKKRLATLLTQPPQKIHEIDMRQQAIFELSQMPDFRFQFQAEGIVNKEKDNIEKLIQWSKERNDFFRQKWVHILSTVMPVITTILIILAILKPAHVSLGVPVIFLATQFFLLGLNNKTFKQSLDTVYPYRKTIKSYKSRIQMIENHTFNNDLLKQLQSQLKSSNQYPASLQINKFSKIVDSISNRMHMFYLVFDILLLWDYHTMIRLEKWKHENGDVLETWFQVVNEFEAYNSLSHIQYDNPDWVVPKIQEKPGVKGIDLGHPLLGDKRITNDVTVQKDSPILLITGSNMSGKSTLLRTVGINMVLAYAGAAVCAKQFFCSRMNIYTCMRVGDNLGQSISSFYAEILRIKKIIEASKKGEEVFFLLDEIFKGTNSEDRHLGARVLIKQLTKQGSMGFVSTHDLELKDLEEETKGNVKNYHFREYYEKNEIKFDYKLRQGVSTTKNALYLIRLAGINID